MAARMPMIATTMSSSISVKPRLPPSASRMVRNIVIAPSECQRCRPDGSGNTGLGDGMFDARATGPGGRAKSISWRRTEKGLRAVPSPFETQSVECGIRLGGEPRDQVGGLLAARHAHALARPQREELGAIGPGGGRAQRPRERVL